MNKKFHVVRIKTRIYENIYLEGEGEFTGCGEDISVGRTFNSLEDAAKQCFSLYGFSEDPQDYEFDEENKIIYSSKMVADHTDKQNGGWMTPTNSEITEWKEGKMKLYVENIDIKIITADDLS